MGISPLVVRLAGVELTPEGEEWLQKNLAPAQTVWLKLISREEDTLHCLVRHSRVRQNGSDIVACYVTQMQDLLRSCSIAVTDGGKMFSVGRSD